jgi:hypothetical protein
LYCFHACMYYNSNWFASPSPLQYSLVHYPSWPQPV